MGLVFFLPAAFPFVAKLMGSQWSHFEMGVICVLHLVFYMTTVHYCSLVWMSPWHGSRWPNQLYQGKGACYRLGWVGKKPFLGGGGSCINLFLQQYYWAQNNPKALDQVSKSQLNSTKGEKHNVPQDILHFPNQHDLSVFSEFSFNLFALSQFTTTAR